LSRTPSVPVSFRFKMRAYCRAKASSTITRECSVSVPRARTSLSPAPRSAAIGSRSRPAGADLHPGDRLEGGKVHAAQRALAEFGRDGCRDGDGAVPKA
jgi:hypothetical protein